MLAGERVMVLQSAMAQKGGGLILLRLVTGVAANLGTYADRPYGDDGVE